jgi:Glyoxalase-like domain
LIVAGGRHEGHGPRNLIVPLGGGYLELLGVAASGGSSSPAMPPASSAGSGPRRCPAFRVI